ncbi:MAG: hypothetical protein HYV02_08510 [Deltaproteobacteria bacterium]|nr:hypothetical protein [Deltaproteobacteria bacterium]
MVKSVEGNTYITSLAADDRRDSAGRYRLQQGRRVNTLDRYAGVAEEAFQKARHGLCATAYALRHTRIPLERHLLDTEHTAHTGEFRDYNGGRIRATIYTRSGNPCEEVVAVNISCAGERIHLATDNPDDLRMVQEAFTRGMRAYLPG